MPGSEVRCAVHTPSSNRLTAAAPAEASARVASHSTPSGPTSATAMLFVNGPGGAIGAGVNGSGPASTPAGGSGTSPSAASPAHSAPPGPTARSVRASGVSEA